MTTAPGHARQTSPWLSVWLSPRDTIERILAANPRRHVLLLAGLGAASQIMSGLIDAGLTTELLDWRVIAAVALVGATIGIAGLYISGLFFRWGGNMLGGRASAVTMRAVLAWGAAPTVISLAICLIALVALKLFGSADAPESASRTLTNALQVTIVVLGLWSLIATMLMLARVQGFGFWRTIVSYVSVSLLFVVFAMLVRTFTFEPFNIPSAAMQPTLLVGDYLFVSKFPYGCSKFSFPLALPLFSGRIFSSPPERGDVAVFILPTDNKTDYIKRIIGLPGDRIQVIHGLLYINDQPVKVERTEDYVMQESDGAEVRLPQFIETLPNGVRHPIIKLIDEGPFNNTPVFVVPPDRYFAMGDNRDNSLDSRTSIVGYVPAENLVGRAEMIFLSIERVSHTRQLALRFERIGMAVQ